MKTTELRVHSGNLTLVANCYGSRENPPVMLVHGYPDDSDIWHKVVPLLAQHFFVITHDVRGCGRSDAPRNRRHYGMRYLMADIFNVIKAVSPGRLVHLVGHDWGSLQSWEAVTEPGAERYLASYTTISGPCLDHIGMGLRRSFSDDLASSLNQLLHSWYIGFFHIPLLAPSLWKLGLDRVWPVVVERTEGIKPDPASRQRKDGINGINLYRVNMLPHLMNPRERYAQVPVQAIIAKRDNYVTEPLLRDLPMWVEDLRCHTIDTGHWGTLLAEHEHTAALIIEFVQKMETGSTQAKALSS
jgi:pimeloyl-ACP methyl ester carboxylesterase